MTSHDPIGHLIREIAVRHGVAVGRDDPILILQTINAQLLEDGQKAQRALLQAHQEELEAIAQRWGHDAKDKAERILTAGLAASKEAMAGMMQEGATVAAASMRTEVDQALGGLSQALQQARDSARINLIAAALTVTAAAITLFATLVR